MPKVMVEEAKPEAAVPAPARARKKPIVLIAIALAVVLAIGSGVYFFVGGKSDESEQVADKGAVKKKKKEGPKLPAQYVKLDPPFVIIFEANGLMRFLQVTVEIMTRDEHTKEIIEKNDPMIRNDLIMLFGSQTYETISTRDGKEKLRNDALATVAKVVKSEGGDAKQVEQLYFTSFVMQ
jgi:flagellar FliL protein